MLALIFFNSKPPYKTLKIWSFEVLNLLLKLFLCWRAKGMFDWSVVACDHKHINIVLWSDKSMTRGEWLQLQVNVRLASDSLVWCHYHTVSRYSPLILSREGEKQEALSRFLSNIYQDGRWRNLTGVPSGCLFPREGSGIQAYLLVLAEFLPSAQCVSARLSKFNFRSWDLSSR